MTPIQVTSLSLSAKKQEHVSFKFKISFLGYLGCMKTKTHVLALQNTCVFYLYKTRMCFGKIQIYLKGKGGKGG